MTPPPGLCAFCTHHQSIPSPRGPTYSLCRLSLTNKRFPKYPALPVVSCPGYQPATHKPADTPNPES